MNRPLSHTGAHRERMPFVPALEVLHHVRQDRAVLTTMGAAREWPKLSNHSLDFHYIPSAMGQAPALALGLALAQTDREFVVLNGDGSMLMNLGVLVTIAASGARNLTLIVLENGVYEVTGGQTTAGEVAKVDFAALARGAGWSSVVRFDQLEDWRKRAAETLSLPGPRFVVLSVARVEEYDLSAPGAMAPRLKRFRDALAAPPL